MAAIAVQAAADWLALEPATLSTAELIRGLLLGVVRNLFVVAFEEVVFRGSYLQRSLAAELKDVLAFGIPVADSSP